MKITAVTQAKEEEEDEAETEKKADHNNNVGIFEILKMKTCSNYTCSSTHQLVNSNNMLLNIISTLLLSYLVIILLLLPQHCLATSSMVAKAATATAAYQQKSLALPIPSASAPTPLSTTMQPPPYYECGSKDIRNNCTELMQLENCTVITGSLDIVLLPLRNTTCDFNQYQFRNLREITGFLIFNDVRSLRNITNMFPNLTVIRGQEVLLNYALSVSAMDSLERLEFRSLIAIQRGHILVNSNPKLFNTEGIYWDRLTLTPGENHIFLENQEQCPSASKCNGCPTDHCWSNQVCQKLENDSVLSPKQNIHECHSQCLGGCYNTTAQGCVVCRSWTDNGTCVNECPSNKYESKQFMRCYTREECVKHKKLYIFKNTCVTSCPGGYKLNNNTGECDSCGGINTCLKVCNSHTEDQPILINHLMNVESFRGCQILNDTVLITLHNRIDERELVENLKDVREIIGHLKINRSPHITSLNFFKNLEKIHGKPMENHQYSLIIYNNKNISELWNVKPGFELVNGGMYIHLNNKLCNRNINKFRENTKHDNSIDSVQTSDQEVLCSPAKLNLQLKVHSHRSLSFTWPKEQTSSEVEIIYRPIVGNEQFTENSEFDTEVCERINWRRDLKFPHELSDNSTHYTYIVQNLEPHTKYAGLVKSFGQENIHHDARSEVKFATTQIDIPNAPKVLVKSKTYNSLTVEFHYDNHEDELVDYYMLEVYHEPEDKDALDSRDYCDGSYIMYKDYAHEVYDDCCSRREEDKEDRLFLKQLENEFSCSLDKQEYCERNHQENNLTYDRKAIVTKRLEHSDNNFIIRSLERFNLYVIQVQACNHAGCSSYSMLSTRTNYSIGADIIYDMSACKMPTKNEYRVYFSEPKLPNAYVTSYALHFRYYSGPNQTNEPNEMVCFTRLQHELNNFLYVGYLNRTFNQAAVRIFSLGHQAFNDWIPINICPTTKLAGKSSHGWNIFFIFFLIGAAGTLLWICYKRKYWRKIPELRRYLPLHMGWNYLRAETDISEDRQILVDGFETVRFHNSPEEDMKYLVH